MNTVTRRCASAVAAALASMSVAKVASAESRSVAAVAPDPQLLRALDVALAPWGTNITEVHPIESPAAMAPDRARAIARDTRADVVLWVSADGGHQTVWIYDVASNHVSSRRVEATPPFDPTTAAAVALSVKALLRSTVVAPLPERTIPVPEEPSWALGLSAGFADHLENVASQSDSGPEGRFGLHASAWPAFVSHKLGVVLDASIGTGVPSHTTSAQVNSQTYSFNYSLQEYEFDAGLGARLATSPIFALEPSLSAAVVLIHVDGTLTPPSGSPHIPESKFRVATGLRPAVAASVTPPGTRLRIAPWVGLTLLTFGVSLDLNGSNFNEVARNTLEGGIRVELAWP